MNMRPALRLLSRLGLAAFTAGGLISCAYPYYGSGNPQATNAAVGAATGAAAGAIIGNQSGSAAEGAIIGGAAGALLGAATTPRYDYAASIYGNRYYAPGPLVYRNPYSSGYYPASYRSIGYGFKGGYGYPRHGYTRPFYASSYPRYYGHCW